MKRVAALIFLLVFAFVAFAHHTATPTTIIFVRHAEKLTDPTNKDVGLSPEGEARAERLARMLAGANVTTVHTTPYVRTRSTAAPTAKMAKVTPIETTPGPAYAADMAAKLRASHGTILVVGHSNTTQDLMKALGVENAPKIEESEYDNLFIVTFTGDGEPTMLHLRY
ncbi:MAG TPA: phosphoglycerate mutase family protein [Thermoanaerobaculia bacterium]